MIKEMIKSKWKRIFLEPYTRIFKEFFTYIITTSFLIKCFFSLFCHFTQNTQVIKTSNQSYLTMNQNQQNQSFISTSNRDTKQQLTIEDLKKEYSNITMAVLKKKVTEHLKSCIPFYVRFKSAEKNNKKESHLGYPSVEETKAILIHINIGGCGLEPYVLVRNPLSIEFGEARLPYGYLSLPTFTGGSKTTYVRNVTILPFEQRQWVVMSFNGYVNTMMYLNDPEGKTGFGVGGNEGYSGLWRNYVSVQLTPNSEDSWISSSAIFPSLNTSSRGRATPMDEDISKILNFINGQPGKTYPISNTELKSIIDQFVDRNDMSLIELSAIRGVRLPGRGNMPILDVNAKEFEERFPMLYQKFINHKSPILTKEEAKQSKCNQQIPKAQKTPKTPRTPKKYKTQQINTSSSPISSPIPSPIPSQILSPLSLVFTEDFLKDLGSPPHDDDNNGGGDNNNSEQFNSNFSPLEDFSTCKQYQSPLLSSPSKTQFESSFFVTTPVPSSEQPPQYLPLMSLPLPLSPQYDSSFLVTTPVPLSEPAPSSPQYLPLMPLPLPHSPQAPPPPPQYESSFLVTTPVPSPVPSSEQPPQALQYLPLLPLLPFEPPSSVSSPQYESSFLVTTPEPSSILSPPPPTSSSKLLYSKKRKTTSPHLQKYQKFPNDCAGNCIEDADLKKQHISYNCCYIQTCENCIQFLESSWDRGCFGSWIIGNPCNKYMPKSKKNFQETSESREISNPKIQKVQHLDNEARAVQHLEIFPFLSVQNKSIDDSLDSNI